MIKYYKTLAGVIKIYYLCIRKEIRTAIQTITMRAQVGKYYFGRHRSNWGIWQYEFVSETGSMGRFIKDVFSYEDAVKEVYSLNGWGQPKQIRRSF